MIPAFAAAYFVLIFVGAWAERAPFTCLMGVAFGLFSFFLGWEVK